MNESPEPKPLECDALATAVTLRARDLARNCVPLGMLQEQPELQDVLDGWTVLLLRIDTTTFETRNPTVARYRQGKLGFEDLAGVTLDVEAGGWDEFAAITPPVVNGVCLCWNCRTRRERKERAERN